MLVGLVGALAATGRARADGFQLERYEPTPAGEWLFAVEHPWYSSTRYFAGGFTLDYGHDPLVAGTKDAGGFHQTAEVVQHQLVGHFDVAGSFLDRVQISASLPVTLYEAGTSVMGIGPSAAMVGDPRIGLMVRVWGQPDKSPIAINLGGSVWIPVGVEGHHSGDPDARGVIKAVLGGLAVGHLRWSFNGGVLIRGSETLGAAIGNANTAGTELQLAGAIGYADMEKRFHVGPELTLGTIVTDGKAFKKDATSLEVLVGGMYNIAKLINIGAAVGLGTLREPGTPDARVIFRIAYAPIREPEKPKPADQDQDGIPDADDACPTEKGISTTDPFTNGCPPKTDRDGDGVPDTEDLCPDAPAGAHPDPAKKGCPLPKDKDGDGVLDAEDLCPDEPAGDHPDPLRKGCPFKDKDNDGVPDNEDLCPDTPAGSKPDSKRPGCPAGDLDGDGVPDDVDACPDRPGAPDTDPKKNGCPKVEVHKGTTTVLQSVYFATNKDTILAKSFPMLQEVAKTLVSNRQIKRVSVEGHADDTGTHEWNQRLSEKRAKSVMQFLTKHGVSKDRLESHGFGDTKPVSGDRSEAGRAANRRVEFRILKEN